MYMRIGNNQWCLSENADVLWLCEGSEGVPHMPEGDLHKTEALLKQLKPLSGGGVLFIWLDKIHIYYRRCCKLIGSRKTVNGGCFDDEWMLKLNTLLCGYGMHTIGLQI